MRLKKVLAVLSLAALLAAPIAAPLTVHAATPGQAQSAADVKYGKVTPDQKKVIETLFDAEYYAANNT